MSARLLVVGLLVVLGLAWPRDARAFGWMVRHGYTSCAQCHADPSGGGLLTAYGRAQRQLLVRTRFGPASPDGADDEEAARVGGFLAGTAPLPDSLLLGADVRGLFLHTVPDGAPAAGRFVLMQSDVAAQVTVDRVRAMASVGYAPEGAAPAALTTGSRDRVVSRVHWLGVDLREDKDITLRAGRLNLPFGLRMPEHTAWVRSASRTDLNTSQQHGAAMAFSSPSARLEIMGIAGNFQMSPDVLRERGYSACAELTLAPRLTLGASSLVAWAGAQPFGSQPTWRQAHGLFARWGLTERVSVVAEGDVLHQSQRLRGGASGYAAWIQVDVEPVQGLHTMVAGETLAAPDPTAKDAYGGWFTVAWFFGPGADVRADTVVRTGALAQLVQLHLAL